MADTDQQDAQQQADGDQPADEQKDDQQQDAGDEFRPITSQDELDRLMRRRLNQQRAQFADYDDAKAKAAKYDELEEANKSELEKAASARAKAEQDASDARRELQEERTRSAILSEAAKQGAVDPDAVFRLLDHSELEIDDTGKPKNAAAAVEALLADRTYLVAGGGNERRKSADQGAREDAGGDQLSAAALEKLSPEQMRDALKAGKMDRALSAGTSGD